MEEQWITDIKNKIETQVEMNLWSLEMLAEQNDVELSYVLETYSDKMTYRINNIVKGQ